MNETKGTLKLVGFWGSFLTVVQVALNMMGYELATDGMAEEIALLVTSLMALYGRMRATKRIKGIV